MVEGIRDKRNRVDRVRILGTVLPIGNLPSAVLGTGDEVSDSDSDF